MTTYDKQTFVTIDIQHSAAGGHARSINLFGFDDEELVKGNRQRKNKECKGVGGFYLLPPELSETAVITAKEKRVAHRKEFLDAVERQMAWRADKDDLAAKKQVDASLEESLEALVFYQQYGSDRCWKTEKEARSIYRRLGSETARLEAVKVRSTIYSVILSLPFDFYCITWPFLLV